MRLNKKQSVIFTVVYVGITLLGRFFLEPFLMGQYWVSIGIGLYFVLLFWVLVHKKFLNFRPEGNSATGAKDTVSS